VKSEESIENKIDFSTMTMLLSLFIVWAHGSTRTFARGDVGTGEVHTSILSKGACNGIGLHLSFNFKNHPTVVDLHTEAKMALKTVFKTLWYQYLLYFYSFNFIFPKSPRKGGH
jgi:hypothetical protein